MINRPEEKEVIFNSIKDDIVNLALHPQGNYVLLLLFGILHGRMLEHIVEQLIEQIPNMAFNNYGICIVNKMIMLTPSIDHANRIVAILARYLTEIIQDPFGNYAITTALEVNNK
jgi:hypothetical protein